MSAVDFEYAIKKDIRNNPIVREVDEARQRQFLRSLAIGAVLVAVVLFSAWQNFELSQQGTRLQKIQEQTAAELEINRQLRLDIETLRSPELIERRARQLNLVWPSRDQAIVIERVTASPAPDKSVVAVR
jgi:cell division protein FtsL